MNKFKFLKKMKIEYIFPLEAGKVYNIYKCGHIFLNTEDPHKKTYNPSTKVLSITCPICTTPVGLKTKIKLCRCGYRQVGKALKSSKQCYKCVHDPSWYKPKTPEQIKEDKRRNNLRLKDVSRYNCYYYLTCLTKYKNYQAVPCKYCRKYNPYTERIDPYGCGCETFYQTI